MGTLRTPERRPVAGLRGSRGAHRRPGGRAQKGLAAANLGKWLRAASRILSSRAQYIGATPGPETSRRGRPAGGTTRRERNTWETTRINRPLVGVPYSR